MIRKASGARAIAALLLALASATPACAQAQYGDPGGISVAPMIDELEGQIIHWVGPQVVGLQNRRRDEFLASHTRDMVMPFGSMKAGDCRMTNAKLVIRRDGTGEFDATTSTVASNADSTWHTTIALFAADGRPLFWTGEFAGPEMNDGKPSTPYVWVNRFTMDPATMRKVYDEIDHASLSYNC
jgi:hypothetical protein